MLTFITPLDCRALPDGIHWELLADLVADIGKKDGKDVIVVPKGFVTDFGSIPKAFQLFVNPQGKSKTGFVLHDFMYQTQERSQLVSDAILNEAMESAGVSWLQRFMVYRGLRLGGWLTWNKYAKINKKKKVK